MAKKNKKAKRMAAKGKSAAQIKAKTGVGSASANRYVAKHSSAPSRASSPAPSRASSPAPSRANPPAKISKGNSLKQNLMIAGGNNNLSKSELLKISKHNDVSADKIVSKLDKLNGKDKDQNIGLGAGAVNAYTKGELGNAREVFWNQAGNYSFGTQGSNKVKKRGKIASTLNDYLGSTSPMVQGQGGQFNNGVTAGRLPAITAGNQINAKGGITTKPTFYGKANPEPTLTPDPTTPTTTPSNPEGGPGGPGDGEYGGSGIEEINDGLTGGTGSSTGINNLGIRRKKSSWASSGKNRGGTNTVARSGFSSGLNIK